jgi:hypothetical protein
MHSGSSSAAPDRLEVPKTTIEATIVQSAAQFE